MRSMRHMGSSRDYVEVRTRLQGAIQMWGRNPHPTCLCMVFLFSSDGRQGLPAFCLPIG